MFARPDGAQTELQLAPVLESWNARNHPDQLRLNAFLDHVETKLSDIPESHLSFELRVGLPNWKSAVSGGGDLDNYLFPIARRLGAARLDAVFGSKHHAEYSTIAVAPSQPLTEVRQPDMKVRTTASASTRAWKEQVHAACVSAFPAEAIEGPIGVDIEFRLSPDRNWSSLWKPAIDSLGPKLGYRDPNRPFAPLDDRIVQLGLHRALDPSLGWDIIIALWWTNEIAH